MTAKTLTQTTEPQIRKHGCDALMPGRKECWIIQGDPCPFVDKNECQYYIKYVLPSHQYHCQGTSSDSGIPRLVSKQSPDTNYNSLGEDNGR